MSFITRTQEPLKKLKVAEHPVIGANKLETARSLSPSVSQKCGKLASVHQRGHPCFLQHAHLLNPVDGPFRR